MKKVGCKWDTFYEVNLVWRLLLPQEQNMHTDAKFRTALCSLLDGINFFPPESNDGPKGQCASY